MEQHFKPWTPKRNAAFVIEVMHGETTVAQASRSFDLVPSEIGTRVDDANQGMGNALRTKHPEVEEH